MTTRRLLYLAALTACVIFYIAYDQWLSWLVLVLVLGLPWFSLLLSLPAMIRFRVSPGCPTGAEEELWLIGSCPYPMPPFQGRLKLKHLITGRSWHYQDREDLPMCHCGGIAATPESVKVCDYLGLFSFPCPSRDSKIILIRPTPLKMDLDRQVPRRIIHNWKPKSGGGYAENHELRLYRPGDSLNQVHWKLSAKTGNLILRQSMEPQQGQVVLTMNLRGTQEELDRKFGRLLWLGQTLLQQQIHFTLQTLTAEGVLTFQISEEGDFSRAVDTLLCKPAATEGSLDTPAAHVFWHCHIGGGPDEA